jgi:hypothetical protein
MAETDGTALRSGTPGARDRSALTAVSLMLMCGRFARFSSTQKFADLFDTGIPSQTAVQHRADAGFVACPKRPGATESSCPCTGA